MRLGAAGTPSPRSAWDKRATTTPPRDAFSFVTVLPGPAHRDRGVQRGLRGRGSGREPRLGVRTARVRQEGRGAWACRGDVWESRPLPPRRAAPLGAGHEGPSSCGRRAGRGAPGLTVPAGARVSAAARSRPVAAPGSCRPPSGTWTAGRGAPAPRLLVPRSSVDRVGRERHRAQGQASGERPASKPSLPPAMPKCQGNAGLWHTRPGRRAPP